VNEPPLSAPVALAEDVAPGGALGGATLTVSVVVADALLHVRSPLYAAWIVSVPRGAFDAVHDAVPLLIVASHKKVFPVEKLTSGDVPVGFGPVEAVTCMV
jgi:hypothetical protein